MSHRFVNDLHSALNRTRVTRILRPTSENELIAIVRQARSAGASLALSGGRHAMGGQQFATDAWLLDLRDFCAIHHFDQNRGWVTVDAGIQWPTLIDGYLALQDPIKPAWVIHQKQTGADRLTLGGALSANAHGRGLRLPPMVGDVEAFSLIGPDAVMRRCSRTENTELFQLAIGGYGLFGIISQITLRLAPRVKVARQVEILTLEELIQVPIKRDTSEWMFGDFQFSIDEKSADFLRLGVFSAYRVVADDRPMPASQRHLEAQDWERLLHLAHVDRARVFKKYSQYYLATSGQLYWSDTHQLSTYLDNYHEALDAQLGAKNAGWEMITEIYVPRKSLSEFMSQAGEILRRRGLPVIYGTIRLIERDVESFLAWAYQPWACVIFNLHVELTAPGQAAAEEAFRGLIDLAISFRGSYFLTYHRWATRAQVEACHPRFGEFLKKKAIHDPTEVFTSDWYRHYQTLFEELK